MIIAYLLSPFAFIAENGLYFTCGKKRSEKTPTIGILEQ